MSARSCRISTPLLRSFTSFFNPLVVSLVPVKGWRDVKPVVGFNSLIACNKGVLSQRLALRALDFSCLAFSNNVAGSVGALDAGFLYVL